MNERMKTLKDEFLMYLYEISKIKMVSYISTFIQGEDALMLRLFMNGYMTPKELSDELKITKGRVTAILYKLKNKNYIEIKENSDDKRSIIVDLTKQGRDDFETKLNIADEYFNNVFSILGEEDAINFIAQIANILNKVKEAGL